MFGRLCNATHLQFAIENVVELSRGPCARKGKLFILHHLHTFDEIICPSLPLSNVTKYFITIVLTWACCTVSP